MLNNYDYRYILRKVLIFIIISFIFFFIKSCQVNALEITTKIGGQAIGGNSYISVNTSGITSNMNISYLYDLSDTNDYDFAIKYNLIAAPTGSGSNVNKKTYYFVLSYCSNVGASVVDIYNSNYNYIDANYGTGTSCSANGNVGELFNAYLRMSPTSANIGNSTIEIIYFNNTLQLQSRFTYNGYIGFNAFNILTYEEYQKAIDNRSILYQQQVLNDSINSMKNTLNQSINNQSYQQHQDSINTQNAINQNTQAQNQTNSILNDDNVSGANAEVDSLLQNNAFNDTSGIQSIINAPLNFINGLTNSCSPISVTIPYIDTPLTIPCIKQELTNHVPTIVPILSTAINGFIIYRILIDIVYLIKSARNPDDDRIEVLDL